MNNNSSNGSSIGFGGVLFVVFMVLKLMGYINWSWWWVTAPLWIPIALAMVLVVVAGALMRFSAKSPRSALDNYFKNLR